MRQIVLLIVVAGALLAPSGATATVHRECRPGGYEGVDIEASPYINDLQATLPWRTSGYAPPCLVADSAAGLIQRAYGYTTSLLTTVHPRGARWDGGTFRCSYAVRPGEFDSYIHARCVSPHGTVTMNLGS